jgi:long-chain fatty acid transport protein
VGLIYRSQAVVPLSGLSTVNGTIVSDIKANLVLPQIYGGGIAIWPVRDREREWKLELDVDYVGWSKFLNQPVSFSTGGGLPAAQNWENAYNIMIGTEYRLLKTERMPDWQVALRAGFTHSKTQMPDAAFNPGIPSADNYIPSLGIGFTCDKNGSFLGLTKCGNLGIGVKPKSIGLDLSYQAAFFETRTITTATPNPAVNGTYRSLIHVGGVSLRFNF